MTKAVTATIIPSALAYGLDAHSARNCADRIKDVRQLERAKAKADAPTDANPLAAAEAFFKKPTAQKVSPKGSRIILKTNKELRARLMTACKKQGGSRLQPVGFDSYSAFLNGFDRVESTHELLPVGGNGKILLSVSSDGSLKVSISK